MAEAYKPGWVASMETFLAYVILQAVNQWFFPVITYLDKFLDIQAYTYRLWYKHGVMD